MIQTLLIEHLIESQSPHQASSVHTDIAQIRAGGQSPLLEWKTAWLSVDGRKRKILTHQFLARKCSLPMKTNVNLCFAKKKGTSIHCWFYIERSKSTWFHWQTQKHLWMKSISAGELLYFHLCEILCNCWQPISMWFSYEKICIEWLMMVNSKKG